MRKQRSLRKEKRSPLTYIMDAKKNRNTQTTIKFIHIFPYFFSLIQRLSTKKSDLCARKINIRKVKVQFWRRNNQMSGL